MNVWNEFWRIFPPSSAPSSSLSNYIIIFLSIKIWMNNLNVWQQPHSEREGFCSAAGTQGCFWWAMHAKLTLLWWKKSKEKKEKKKQSAKNFTPVKFDATTSKVWHRNTLADMKYLTRLQQGCSRWKHTVVLANTCQSVAVSYSLIRVNDFIGMTVVQKQVCQMQNVGYILRNRKTIHRFKPNIHTRWCAHVNLTVDEPWMKLCCCISDIEFKASSVEKKTFLKR